MPEVGNEQAQLEWVAAMLDQYGGKTPKVRLPFDQKVALAKEIAAVVAPMWGHIIRRWEVKGKWGQERPVWHGRTMTVDSQMPLEEMVGTLIHVTDHMVMQHKSRQGDRDKHLWNIAACLEGVKRWDDRFHLFGVKLPKGLDPREQGQDLDRNEAENLYDELEQQQQQGQGQGQGQDSGDLDESGDPQAGQGQGKPGQGQPGQGQPGQGQPGQGQPGQGKGQPGKGQPGAEDGTACKLEDSDFDETMMADEGMDGQDGQDGDKGQGQTGKPGQKPGPPGSQTGDQKIDAQAAQAFQNLVRVLKRRMHVGSSRRDYSAAHPSNRSELTGSGTSQGVISSLYQLPDNIRVVGDCSGSLDSNLVATIAKAIAKLQQSSRDSKIMVAFGDTELKTVGTVAEVIPQLRGGGGTDMKKVFTDAVHHPKMRGGSCWLFITDGETDTWPDQLPPNSVVLIINDKFEDDLRQVPAAVPGYGRGYPIPEHIRAHAIVMSKQKFLTGRSIQHRGVA